MRTQIKKRNAIKRSTTQLQRDWVRVISDQRYWRLTSLVASCKELRTVIERYFHRGYENKVILDFLKRHHGITISIATLKRRLRDYGLRRRGVDVEEDQLENVIRQEMSGPGEFRGYGPFGIHWDREAGSLSFFENSTPQQHSKGEAEDWQDEPTQVMVPISAGMLMVRILFNLPFTWRFSCQNNVYEDSKFL